MNDLRTIKLILVLLAPALLGGCSALRSLGLVGQPRAHGPARPGSGVPVQAARGRESGAFVETERGRQALRARDFVAARAAFNAALAHGEPAAPALNGLGVALVSMGQDKLALQYFMLAASFEPTNATFAANLARIRDAMASGTRPLSPATVQPSVQRRTQVARLQTGALENTGHRQFHIRTVAPERGQALAQIDAKRAPPKEPKADEAGLVGTPQDVAALPTRESKARSIAGFTPVVRIDLAEDAGEGRGKMISGFKPFMRVKLNGASAARKVGGE